jgi:NAD+ synthase
MSKVPVDRLAIAVAQLNPIVGDVSGNLERARIARAEAARDGADVVAFSELFIAGYPPEDLVLKPAFQAACRSAVEALARATGDGGPAVLVGTPWVEEGKLHNAYALLAGGRIEAIRFKVNLPNYGVFDEKRVFAPGPVPGPVNFGGVRLGLPICEDTWTDWGDYENVVECLAETGAELILVPNGSPYWRDKADTRLNVSVARVTEAGLPLIYVNQVGGQDELVFDGASFRAQRRPVDRLCVAGVSRMRRHHSLDARRGRLAMRARANGSRPSISTRPTIPPACSACATTSTRTVSVASCSGFPAASIRRCARSWPRTRSGLSACRCVMLPFRYTSQASLDDAAAIAQGARRKIRRRADRERGARARRGAQRYLCRRVARRHRGEFAGARTWHRPDGDLQQVRPDGGDDRNKSEMSVGYATLYGDMNGGFNPIKDLYKTEVFRLARLRNAWRPEGALGPDGPLIPENVLTRAPSAELRENQTDQDTLPPYDVLDQILERLVEREEPLASIIAAGFDRETVMKVERMLALAEYKRRQAGAGREGDAKEFRSRPALSDHQPVPRSRTCAAAPDRSLLKSQSPPRRARQIFERRFAAWSSVQQE